MSIKPTKSSVRLGRLEEFIGFQLRRVQNQLSRDFAAKIADRNMRSGLFSILALVQANPGISQTRVSKAVGLDKSVTVQIVDEMEERGYARRERSTTDRRQHALYVTEKGEEFLDEMFLILKETEAVALGQLQPYELAMLHDVLNRMYAIFEHRSSRTQKGRQKDS